jgi:amidohydrolase
MRPTLERVGPGAVAESALITGAEDFTYYQRRSPGLFIALGVTPKEQIGKAAANHSPRFFVDERALVTGVRALAHLAADYLFAPGVAKTAGR